MGPQRPHHRIRYKSASYSLQNLSSFEWCYYQDHIHCPSWMPARKTSRSGNSEVTTAEQIAALFKGSKLSDGGLSNVRAALAVESVGTSDAFGRNAFKNALHWPKAYGDESEKAICMKGDVCVFTCSWLKTCSMSSILTFWRTTRECLIGMFVSPLTKLSRPTTSHRSRL